MDNVLDSKNKNKFHINISSLAFFEPIHTGVSSKRIIASLACFEPIHTGVSSKRITIYKPKQNLHNSKRGKIIIE